MTTAREVMHSGVECVRTGETLTTIAQRMAESDIGAMPVCDDDNRLKGIITDRDIVVKAIAKGRNPSEVRASDLIAETPVWVEAGTDVDEVLHHMVEHRIRRLPVMENKELVGIISQADLAAKLPEEKVGVLVEAISTTSH